MGCSEWKGPSWDCQCEAVKLTNTTRLKNTAKVTSPKTETGTFHVIAKKNNTEDFCCFAARNPNDVCGTCHEIAKVRAGTWHCGQSKEVCLDCGNAATWCESDNHANLMLFDTSEHTMQDVGVNSYLVHRQPSNGILHGAMVAMAVGAVITTKCLLARVRSSDYT